MEISKTKKERKSKSQSNSEYYQKNKEKNHRNALLSDIRTNGRVPHLFTVHKRKLSISEVVDAWKRYEAKTMETGEEIAPLKIMEMRVLIGNMI